MQYGASLPWFLAGDGLMNGSRNYLQLLSFAQTVFPLSWFRTIPRTSLLTKVR